MWVWAWGNWTLCRPQAEITDWRMESRWKKKQVSRKPPNVVKLHMLGGPQNRLDEIKPKTAVLREFEFSKKGKSSFEKWFCKFKNFSTALFTVKKSPREMRFDCIFVYISSRRFQSTPICPIFAFIKVFFSAPKVFVHPTKTQKSWQNTKSEQQIFQILPTSSTHFVTLCESLPHKHHRWAHNQCSKFPKHPILRGFFPDWTAMGLLIVFLCFFLLSNRKYKIHCF